MATDLHAGMVKVFFEPPNDPKQDWHTTVESMWANTVVEPNAPGGIVYALDNSPWYVFGVSVDDQVCAELRHEVYEDPAHAEFDVLYFTKVWKHLGHSTYALLLLSGTSMESESWNRYWSKLKQMGCSYEGMSSRLLSMDVVPDANLKEVEAILDQALAENVFDYQTQHRFKAEG